ncbi:PQQ-binding-like beta-propeller repeat protein [Candidatus Symbiobacter mobilis]|uniref:Outer membrane protein assembly factor BamB n=1 Tax=Candidatus Symbiobacter mobilis CR TaxID=946483 RepID=U5NCP1_9BURK|nr:PQQ-binding-like beta-propeller repeat protein [Candidatus Symbiobacter mobilis]AGX87924.1 WD40 repeat protein [Candidatus Symbiobacter mobilis CR]
MFRRPFPLLALHDALLSALHRSLHSLAVRRTLCAFLLPAALLGACASGPRAPEPAPLGPDPARLAVRTAWTRHLGTVGLTLRPAWKADVLTVANAAGTVLALRASTGEELWRVDVGHPLSAGVGSDGRRAAVVTQDNVLVALDDKGVSWKQPLSTQVITPPLVAGERVFVLGGDRSVMAFDGKTGHRLWRFHRHEEALVLGQPSVLMAVGDTLVVAQSGHLIGLHPATASVLWDAPLATPRETSDIDRLVDLVEGVSRNGYEVCVRAYHYGVGCVSALHGGISWSKSSQGHVGLSGDARWVYGVDSDGTLRSWRRSDGEPGWTNTDLRYRKLGRAVLAGDVLVVGDDNGMLHWFSSADGAALARSTTDGSAIVGSPLWADSLLIAVTRHGGVYAFGTAPANAASR